MRLLPLGFVAVGIAGFLWPSKQPAKKFTLVLYGSTNGHLSPCGCTSPMSGGIRRAATVIRQREAGGDAVFVMTGDLVSGRSRQDELKAETYAESSRTLAASGVEFGVQEAALGPGNLLQMDQLSDGKLLSSAVIPSSSIPLTSAVEQAPFMIASVSRVPEQVARPIGAMPASTGQVIDSLQKSAREKGLMLVLLYDGDEDQARSLAVAHPDLAAVVYRSTSDPPAEPSKVGNTVLITTGFHGKWVVSVGEENSKFADYRVFPLGPDVPDDKEVSGVYSNYLQRVSRENLLAQWPRHATAAYAGSQACRSCHAGAYRVWEHSAHFHSLHDLVLQGHGRDPDCVSCHVTGLSSLTGFYSEEKTPQLADVSCESCHGPALRHSRAPRAFRLPPIGEKQCVTCHTLDNSPRFQFAAYLRKIRH